MNNKKLFTAGASILVCGAIIIGLKNFVAGGPATASASKNIVLPAEVKALVEDEAAPTEVQASNQNFGQKPSRSYEYYKNGFDVLSDYVKREDVVQRLNKNQVSEAQREYFLKLLEKQSWYKLRAVDLKLREIEGQIGS